MPSPQRPVRPAISGSGSKEAPSLQRPSRPRPAFWQ